MNAWVAGIGVLLLVGCQPAHAPQAGSARSTVAPGAAVVNPAMAGRASSNDAADGPQNSPGSGGIAWFHGSVEQAFASAQRKHRPVLLFWGAKWCPFCHTLEATVFPRPDFIARTRLFVPVYLDGDDPGAQRWGEQFGIRGYPTMVLLDSDRHELMRLGAGRDVSEYAVMLDVALQQLQPVEELLAKATAGKGLDADECRRLAYNSWELDTLEPDEYSVRAARLARSAEACPPSATLERANLAIYAAGYAADAAAARRMRAYAGSQTYASGARDAAALPSAQLPLLSDAVEKILANPRLAVSSAPALQNLDVNFFAMVRARGPRYARQVRAAYVAAMDAAADDPRYVTADQLGFLDAKIVALTGLGEHALSPAMLAAADQRIDRALAVEQDPYVRPGLVNASLNILEDSGQYQEAYRIAKDEIGRSDAPYYYQADLAEVAEKLGHRQEAIALLEQAYQGSRGPATRFQWGQLYLSGLLRMAPRDAASIQRVGLQVLDELGGTDRIADRTRARLEQLDAQLRAWNRAAHGAHAAVLQALHARMQAECVQSAAQTAAHAGCEAFLATAT